MRCSVSPTGLRRYSVCIIVLLLLLLLLHVVACWVLLLHLVVRCYVT